MASSNNELPLSDLFIPYLFALKMQELGFMDPCLGYYSKITAKRDSVPTIKDSKYNSTALGRLYVDAPTYEQAFNWFSRTKSYYSFIIGNGLHEFAYSTIEVDNSTIPTKVNDLTPGVNFEKTPQLARKGILLNLLNIAMADRSLNKPINAPIRKQDSLDLFIPFELAQYMKTLGFREQCAGYFKLQTGTKSPSLRTAELSSFNGKTYISAPENYFLDAPLWDQAFNWFYSTFALHGYVSGKPGEFDFTIQFRSSDGITGTEFESEESVEQFTEARQFCLTKLCEMSSTLIPVNR